MRNDRIKLESYFISSYKRKRLQYLWKGLTMIIFYTSLVSIALAVPVLSTWIPWWAGLLIVFSLSIFYCIIVLLKPMNITKICTDLDERIFKDQSLITFYEFSFSGNYKKPYYNILKNRVFEIINNLEHKKVYSFNLTKEIFSALTVFAIAALLSFYSYTHRPLPDYVLAADYIEQAASRLAVREDYKDTFSTAIEKMNKLEEQLNEDKDSSGLIKKSIETLARDLTDQLQSLRRDSLSSLIEEKLIDHQVGSNLNKMLRDDLSVNETREFVLDLLTDNNLSDNQRHYIQKSYEDYSSNSDTGKSSDLAEDLIDNLSPDSGRMSEQIGAANDLLNNALEKLKTPDVKEMAATETHSEPGIPGSHENPSGEAADGLSQNRNNSSASGGSGENMVINGDDFTPFEENDYQATLPEGNLIIDSDSGILRLEGDEKLKLERIVGISDDIPFAEGLIRNYEIPSNMRELVKKYFTIIGEVSVED